MFNLSSPQEVFLRKGILKICSNFTGEHSRRSAISIKLLCNFFEIALQHGCSPVNLLDTFSLPWTPFLKNIKNTSRWLFLCFDKYSFLTLMILWRCLTLKKRKKILHLQLLLQTFGPSKNRGRKSIYELFPGLIGIVNNFEKQHSFAAHGRRREAIVKMPRTYVARIFDVVIILKTNIKKLWTNRKRQFKESFHKKYTF